MKPEKLTVRAGDKEFSVVVNPGDAGGVINLDGTDYPVELRRLGAGSVSLILEGRSYLFNVSSNGSGEYSLGCAGGEIALEVEDERARLMKRFLGTAAGGRVRKRVRAPMPGLVVKLLVETGAQVKKGQPLAVVEAMKMENEITAHTGGTIAEITVSERQAVEKNEVLMVIE